MRRVVFVQHASKTRDTIFKFLSKLFPRSALRRRIAATAEEDGRYLASAKPLYVRDLECWSKLCIGTWYMMQYEVRVAQGS